MHSHKSIILEVPLLCAPDRVVRQFNPLNPGLHVFATARHLESMSELAALGITTLCLDVTDIDNIRKTRDHIAAITGGKLDILVNNAYVFLPLVRHA